MLKKIELLAPGGDIESIKSAIIAGADAIYCGINGFNARQRAKNITFNDLMGILGLAHKNNCKIFLTLNIIFIDTEFPRLIELLNKLSNTSIDGIIVQDLGLLYILKKYFNNLEIHASTQLTTHNEGQIKFLNKFGVRRINLSRELSFMEIEYITKISHKNNIKTEVFIHGSNCISFSGICYFSSVLNGNSGNRGICSQPCRAQYIKTAKGKDYPLNIKDKSAFFDLKELKNIGVDSLKIEGRIKKFHYVYTVVNTWRHQIDKYYKYNILSSDSSDLHKVFNRGFSNTFLKGDISKNMFIDNPRDNSATYFSKKNNITINESKKELQNIKTGIINSVKRRIDKLEINKIPINIVIEGEFDDFLKIIIKTPYKSFSVTSKTKLSNKGKYPLNKEFFNMRFNVLNRYEYRIEKLNLDKLNSNLFISFKDLKIIRDRILYLLNDSLNVVKNIELPVLNGNNNLNIKSSLSILISSKKDLDILDKTNNEVFFKIPDSLEDIYSEYLNIFLNNKKLIPWFPSIIIGNDYDLSIRFIEELKPRIIVTNNLGIAYEAYKMNINWIAGPYLNIVNSFSLISLKKIFNCSGSFISNEIGKTQIKKIKTPENFKLYYSIYHPILLLTTRQCLFHQVIGCEKSMMNKECIKNCSKNSNIMNFKNEKLLIKKKKGYYHSIYNNENFLNTNIIFDFKGIFSNFLIDLSDIKTNTNIKSSNIDVINGFQKVIDGDIKFIERINKTIENTTNKQYKKGI